MISTVFNAATVFLINDDWSARASDFKVDFSLIRDEQRSLTTRAARRPYQQTVLCKVQYQVLLKDAAVRATIGSLRALNTQKVIVPFWPALQRWADRGASVVTGGLKLAFKADWSNFALYMDAEPGWAGADDLWCPALMGFIAPTQPRMLSPDAATWDIDFQENSPAAYALDFSGATAAAAGPQPAGYAAAPKLLPAEPDFQQVDEQISVEVKREKVGFNREQLETFYPQAAARVQQATYTLAGDDIWALLKFFQEVMAPGAAFWASTWLQAARLAGDASAGDDLLTVQEPNGVLVGDYLSIYQGSNRLGFWKVTAKADGSLNLNAVIGTELEAGTEMIFQLCLAKLSDAVVSLSWRRPGAAKCELQWEELPPEYVIPADETLATTIGKLPLRVVLIELSRDYGNGTVDSWNFTSFEKDIVDGAITWLSQGAWDVGEITNSLNLQEDSLDLATSIFAGNPLNNDVALRAEAPMTVTITYADFDGAALSNKQVMFTGDATSHEREGNKLTIKCRLGPAIFDTQLPAMLRGTMCNFLNTANNDGTFLISAACTLLKANWKSTALVIAPVGNAFPFTLHVDTLTGVGADAIAAIGAGRVFANWFANGWIEWGAGANIQRRLIIGSTAPVAGALDLTLHRYFSALPAVGDTVTLFPGCDGLAATCKAFDAVTNPLGKFNNYVNFGGEPFTPIANPSTSGQPNLNTRGAKK